MNPSLSIVLPVFNESSRIVKGIQEVLTLREKLLPYFSEIEILVVDDGSTDGCVDLIHTDVVTIIHGVHLGKGATVKKGLLESKGDWVVFSDIDWSVPVETVKRLILQAIDDNAPIIIASREVHGSKRIAEPPWRHILGKIFNRWVQWVLLSGHLDTQCGCKILDRASIQSIAPLMQENGWAFDVELLLLAHLQGIDVNEFAVSWVYQPQSKIRLFQDGIRMARAIIRMRERVDSRQYVQHK